MSEAAANTSTPRDFTGKEVTLGCAIVYPTRKGSEMWLSRGKVVNITTNAVVARDPHTLKVETLTHKGDRRIVYIPSPRSVVVA